MHKEYYIYSYNPVKDFRYNLSKSHFRISDEIIFLKNNLKNCNAKKVECKKDYRFVMKKYKDKYFIIKKMIKFLTIFLNFFDFIHKKIINFFYRNKINLEYIIDVGATLWRNNKSFFKVF